MADLMGYRRIDWLVKERASQMGELMVHLIVPLRGCWTVKKMADLMDYRRIDCLECLMVIPNPELTVMKMLHNVRK